MDRRPSSAEGFGKALTVSGGKYVLHRLDNLSDEERTELAVSQAMVDSVYQSFPGPYDLT